MKRISNGSSVGSLSTPVAASQWGSQRTVEVGKQLFPRASSALAKLRRIEGMQVYEDLVTQPVDSLPPHLKDSFDVVPPGEPLDPVSLVRRLLRVGAPLTLAFNAASSATTLEVLEPEPALDLRAVKRAIYRFCEACVQEFDFKWDTDLFTISQIFNDGSGELLKPLHTLEMLLSRLDPGDADGFTTPPQSPKDKRSKIVEEFLQTERKYVQDLDTLMEYHDAMLALNFPRETVQKITPGLAQLLDFQRRFLVGLEYAGRLSPQRQNFGWLFLHLRDGFEIYKEYTINQKEATQTALAETGALMPLSHILEPMYELPATLLKPVQRIMRYPLLLKELVKHTPEQWPHYAELATALEVMHEMMADVNEAQRRAENVFVSRDLQNRVKDWKGLDFSAMGELLLSGLFPVSSMGESEQEYNLYLFERVLLCCRDRVSAKKTPLTKMRPAAARYSQGKSLSLELKGRIYLNYITAVSTAKLPNGGWLLSLGWGHRGDASEQGAFEVRLVNEESAQLWESTIQKLVSSSKIRSAHSSSGSVSSFAMNSPFSQSRSSQASLSASFGRWVTTSVGSIEDDYSGQRGVQFYDDPSSGSPMDALRKLSVSSTSSQHTHGSNSGGSGMSPGASLAGSRSSLSLNQGTPVTRQRLGSRPSLKSGESTSSLHAPGQRKVRIYSQGDTFLILVPPEIGYAQLVNRVERKLRLCGKFPSASGESGDTPVSLKYKDEDDDLVRLESDEDLAVAFEEVSDHLEVIIYVN